MQFGYGLNYLIDTANAVIVEVEAAPARWHFTFDRKHNVYVCPAGKPMTTSGRMNADNGIRYFASVLDCRACALKPKCCPNMASRRIVRDLDESGARDEFHLAAIVENLKTMALRLLSAPPQHATA